MVEVLLTLSLSLERREEAASELRLPARGICVKIRAKLIPSSNVAYSYTILYDYPRSRAIAFTDYTAPPAVHVRVIA